MRRPASTYRLQLTPTFGFRAAAEVVPYLAALGVTDVYLSPPFEAMPGSMHGYDVVDPNKLRGELGGDEGYAALCDAIAAAKMGQLVDFVPNHMGVGPSNPWWMDVLENGPSSVYAPFFDIDWTPVKHELEDKVLVPVLGDQFGAVLERGELRLARDGGSFHLDYFEHRFPIAPRAVPRILEHRLGELACRLGEEDVHLQELRSIISALQKLAPRTEVDPAKVAERAREKEVAKRRLGALFEASQEIRGHIDENVLLYNGAPGDPRSFDLLAELLDHQAYRLAHWRVAGEEINYRRFFDINSLAAIRVEDERVFEEVHRLIFRLIAEGKVTGLRIDHPDGLYTPSAYFRRLHSHVDGLYIVVEKILEAHERMPESWRVDGTTGYEILNCLNGLYVAAENARAFDDLYARFVGAAPRWQALVEEKKRALMSSSMASELHVLAHRLNQISERDRRTRDFTLSALAGALIEYVARLPVYRTYVEGTSPGEVEERDRRYIESTIARARRASRHLDKTIYDFLRDLLLLERPDAIELVRKLQQVTGPVAAKAIEDSACYVYQRLVSLNEVGGNPIELGRAPESFHALCQERLRRWPGSLNATSTHDTKRSEDVRLRISALSEIPVEWEARLFRWAQLNLEHKRLTDGVLAPEPNDELLIYQTLIGVFPDDGEVTPELIARVVAYLEKALREAKVHSSWTNPDEPYEHATADFARALFRSRPFLDDFVPFERRLAHAARLSSLSQVALKLAAPGVADIYQGCELWDLSLVDPDNRRPVDFAQRAHLLKTLDERQSAGPEARVALARELSEPGALVGGQAKLLLTASGLRLRRAEPALFLRGEYLPLAAEGPLAAHVVAFARRLVEGGRERRLLCVAPRLLLGLLDAGATPGKIDWEGRLPLPPELASATLVDAVTGRTPRVREGALALDELFADFPVALLSG